MDKKELDAHVASIAAKGGSHNKTPTPGGFSERMSAARAAKKTPRPISDPTPSVSSTAPPNVTRVNKTKGERIVVKQAKTTVPVVKKGKKGPTMQTGPGKGAIVHNHYYGKGS